MYEKIYQPTPTHTAQFMGSGGLEVLATPALVAFMENCAFEWLENQLESGQTSVGTKFDIDHLGASLIEDVVTVQILERTVDGRAYHFSLEALVKENVIATAQHTRFVIDTERFLSKLK